ncbi:MAG TPA: ABC transporter ATP-binding protein [Jatrophihabitans sp.]|nr:ABC transporter ATP-binding protein [Jatrophihabitans sp.]
MRQPQRGEERPDQQDPLGPAEIASPYWALDTAPDVRSGLLGTMRRLPGIGRPVLAMIYRSAPGPAVVLTVALVLSGLVSMFGLLAGTAVLNRLLMAGPTSDRVVAAVPALVVVALLYGARGALDALAALARARLGPAVRQQAALRLVGAALSVELAAFDDDSFYDRMHRARDRGVLNLDRSVGSLAELVGAGLAMLGAAGALLVLHPLLIAVLLLGVLPEAWSVLRSAQLGYAGMRRLTTLSRRMWMLGDLTTGRPASIELRSYQAQPYVLDEYRQVTGLVRAEESRVETGQARVRAIGRALAGIGAAATLVALGLLLRAGWIPLAVAGGSAIAIRTATAAVARLVIAANQLFEQGLYVGDYQEFLADAARRTGGTGHHPAPAEPRCIELDRVGFRYPGSLLSRPALQDVSLQIDAGSTVALVGANGSGKSTLAKLIAGLYQPTTGEIRWDGLAVADLDPHTVADRVVMVSQNPMQWPQTARTNVRLGRHDRFDPDDAALREAAVLARADEVIDALPRGWQTLLSKEFRAGHELSGGQWQRLAIARALFRDAPILICDEPAAPLDAHAELAVYESLRRLADGRTIVLISHRLTSVQHADQIVVLHHGRIVERGRHEELMAAGRHYHRMYTVQSQLAETGLTG